MTTTTLGLLLACSVLGAKGQPAEQPNIVILLADDLGYADVGYHGSDIQTPNIDRFAGEGVRLERFYACPVCSPTRAGLMTGRWPIRYGLARTVIPPWRDYGLPTDETTLADTLAGAGYKHRACVGKWHLGHLRTRWLPNQRGFSHFHGHYNGAIDYFTHEREEEVDWHRNDAPLDEAGYSTDLLARAAVAFIEGVPRDEPYFLYVPWNAPHSPFEAKPEELAKYPERRGNRQALAAMIDSLDQGIGKVLRAIDRRGDAENTFVLFFSDNGGVAKVADNRPLRGHKATTFEGGIRVVAAVRWPAGGLVGGKVCNQPMGNIDVLPTVRRIVGIDTPSPKPLDGIDVLDAMRGKKELPHRYWFTYIDMSGGPQEHVAVQDAKWKLKADGPAVTDDAFARQGQLALYRVDRPGGEETDLASQHPEIVQQMLVELKKFRALKIPDGVLPYSEGHEGFVAPKHWVITEP